ncbi:MAG: hypothetical protein IJZ94_05345 [Clostridia bacterium]|nr:hypothetical protein [Clostridia bacterium]
MKFTKRLTTLILALAMVLSCNTFSLSMIADAATTEYINSLIAAGFPESYATLLAEVHDEHPSWTFEPVLITSLNSAYTWDYIVEQEMYPTRNLVTTDTWAPSGYDAYYSPYYDETDTNLYDSGWRQASQEAVEYFMDPRNFLNDIDIFMFESLAYNSSIHTVSAVESALTGTFMAASNGTVDGTNTYATLIYNLGVQYNINPIYIANRIILEQGTAGTSPLVNGTLGTAMWSYYSDEANRWNTSAVNSSGQIIWGGAYDNITYTEAELKARDGLYNFFNMGASGTGVFEIYMNASNESKTEGWTTKTAAVTGGVKKVYNKYIANYQHTPYFQKFNTHPGSSNNFWGQYMQDISGALKGGRRAYNDYSDTNGLEAAHNFVIPVYGGMPTEACPDPAGGYSYYSPSTAPGSIAATQRHLNIYVASGEGIADFGEGSETLNKGTIGDTINFRTIPASGYTVTSVNVNGEEWEVLNNGSDAVYQFTMPSEDVDIYVTFTPLYTTTANDLVFESQVNVDWLIDNSVLSEGVQLGLGSDAAKNDTYLIVKSPTTDNDDQHITIDFSNSTAFSASTYKYIVIAAKTSAANASAGMYVCAGSVTDPTTDAYVPITWDNDGLWHEYVIDLTSISSWTGTVHKIRFDFFEGTTTADSEIDIRSIRFATSNPASAKVTASSTSYVQGSSIKINYYGLSSYYGTADNMKPFVGIYADGTEPGGAEAIQYSSVTDASGSLTFPADAEGGTNTSVLPVGTYKLYLGYDASGQSGCGVNNVIMAASSYTFTVVSSSDVNTDTYQTITGGYSGEDAVVANKGDTVLTALTTLENTYGTSSVTIKTAAGAAVDTSAILVTGMVATVDGTNVNIIVMGDVDGDGTLTIADAQSIMLHAIGKTKLSGAYADAAMVNNYTSITVLNVMYILNNM